MLRLWCNLRMRHSQAILASVVTFLLMGMLTPPSMAQDEDEGAVAGQEEELFAPSAVPT